MPQWIVSLISVVTTFLLTKGWDVVKDHQQAKKRRSDVRRLLAHHATTLAEDASSFLAIAQRCFGLPEPEIASRFADVTSSEHVYRDQIAARLNDMSDELITLFKDLDLASNSAAHSIEILQRWSSTFFGSGHDGSRSTSRSASSPRERPTTLTEELESASKSHRTLLDLARAMLKRLDEERTVLPTRSTKLLEAPNRTLEGQKAPELPPPQKPE